MQPVRIGRSEGALARLCRRRESVLLLAGGWAPALQLCFETPALSAEEAQCQRWVTFDSDELSIGLPYGIRYPYGWTVNQVKTPKARLSLQRAGLCPIGRACNDSLTLCCGLEVSVDPQSARVWGGLLRVQPERQGTDRGSFHQTRAWDGICRCACTARA